MMAVWEQLSEEELFFILKCEKFGDIIRVFQIRRQITLEQWQQDARQHYHADYGANFLSQSIFSSLNDAPSFSFMTLLAMIGMAAIKVLTLTFLTAGFSAMTLVIGGIFIAASYQEFCESRRKAEKFLDFATIKIQCADELTKRQRNTLRKLSIDPDTQLQGIERSVPLKPFTYQNNGILQKLKPALGMGVLTGTMLFGTYYLGISAIIAAFGAAGAAAAMISPIGIGIAIAVTLLFAAYSGYRHYQSKVATERIEKQQSYASREFAHKRDECFELQHLIHEHQQSIHDHLKTFSDPDLLHKKNLAPNTSLQRSFLLRRENIFRRKNPKFGTGNLTSSTHNINKHHRLK